MKEKLTKNVSMSSKVVTTEVINAAFLALLTRSGVYLDYFHYWADANCFKNGESISDAWEKWARETKYEGYVSCAFAWDKTNLQLCVWMDLHKKWLEWLATFRKK